MFPFDLRLSGTSQHAAVAGWLPCIYGGLYRTRRCYYIEPKLGPAGEEMAVRQACVRDMNTDATGDEPLPSVGV